MMGAAPSGRSMSSYEIIGPRRIALAALAILAAAAPAARATQVTVVEPDGAVVVRDDPAVPVTTDLAAEGVRAPRECAPAAPPAAAAPARPTVPGTLRRLEHAGAPAPEERERDEAAYRHARVVRDRLSGLRKHELSAVVGGVQRLAARRLLTAPRVPVVFMQLARNVEYWPAKPIPKAPQ